jgi:serpin B
MGRMSLLSGVLLAGAAALAAAGCGGDDATSSGGEGGDDAAASGGEAGEDAAASGGEGGEGNIPAAESAVLSPTAGIERSEPAADAPVGELAAGLNDAGFALLRTQPTEDNLVFSAASIGHALLMARAAADSSTGDAIDAAFGLPAGLAAHQAWNATDQMLAATAQSEDEITISIADRIWPRLDVTPDQAWIDLLVAEHGVSTEALDFAGNPAGSRKVINQWVDDQTQGLIPELLPEGFIKPDTVLVLTDALYFKARWQTVFGKYQSVMDTFTRLDGSSTEVEFLRELELADLRGEGDGFVGAEIPYVGGELSMLLIVPDSGRFSEIRDSLGQELLDQIDASFSTGPYELLMPMWTTNTQLDLLVWLTELGAAPGSYPGITEDAFLAAAVHGADITVDEWGTVAAAATALGFEQSGPPEPELTVKADRPYLYLIRHRPTGLVLFAGQVTDPNA